MQTKLTLLATTALAGLAIAGVANAQETTTAWKGAPQFVNDTLTFKVRGRVYYDVVSQDVDFANPSRVDENSDQSRVRTARLGVEGTWNQNWAYKAEASISSAGGVTQWEDITLEYKPNDTTSLMVGNYKVTGFENISSSRYNLFMERGAFNDVMDNGRVMMGQVKMNGENWTASAFVHGDSINAADLASGSSEQFAYGFRGTYVPVNGDFTKLHIGGSARWRDHGQGAAPLLHPRVRNNTNFGNRYTDAGALFDKDTQYAAEFLLIHKQFSLQSEYVTIEAERPNGQSHDINGYYVAASWFPTGEMRNLDVKRGELGRTRILNPMTAGGMGAFELAVRYDNVDMSDAFVQARPTPAPAVAAISPLAGEYSAVTLGVNWYPFPYVRFMLNYTDADNDLTPILLANPANIVDPDVQVKTLQFRAQYDF